ncbi:BTAD domain-containing putative transcriptional regulator [Amycolatopsis sp. cmx-4-54]|uniref:AfsR/SARP family transcriptional regulator n=1 Tax=Amycolatopsis sp. cmx-4-54 TaxID=2790936 RepID=UPI00397B26AF
MQFDRPRQGAVLAGLALRAGRPVRQDELVRTVWGQEPPPSATGNLHTYISELRKILGEPQVLHTDRDGYRLDVRVEDVDALEFDSWVDRAAHAWSGGAVETCFDAVDRATELWTGAPLPEIAGPVADAERRRLEDRWLALRKLRVQALLTTSQVAEAVAECTSLTHAYPLDERVAVLHSTSLYRAGQVAEALGKLDTFRRRLREETGTQPGAEADELYEQMLTGDVDTVSTATSPSTSDGRSATPDSSPRAVRPAQLPHRPWGFVGREHETAELSHPADLPIVITGHAGIGKSALACQVAHELAPRFPDGQLYLSLGGSERTSVPPMSELLDHQLLNLGVHTDDLPGTVEQKAARWRSLLTARRVLVVLDDAADAEQVARLLPEGTTSAAIVTSRSRLSTLDKVRRVPLPALEPDAAKRLLIGGCGTPLDVPLSDPRVARIVEVCGYVPLAVRAAAVLLAEADTVRQFTLRLRNHENFLELLSPGDNDSESSVLAGLEHTTRTLSAPALALLTRLSSRIGEEEHIAGLPREHEPVALAELVESCLLDHLGGDRYRVPALVRRYGRLLTRAGTR